MKYIYCFIINYVIRNLNKVSGSVISN
jgi:hypothetical protein